MGLDNLELTPEIRTDHAAYIQSWLKVLKDDKRAIFSAAAHAQRAADFLHVLQPQTEAKAEKADLRTFRVKLEAELTPQFALF